MAPKISKINNLDYSHIVTIRGGILKTTYLALLLCDEHINVVDFAKRYQKFYGYDIKVDSFTMNKDDARMYYEEIMQTNNNLVSDSVIVTNITSLKTYFKQKGVAPGKTIDLKREDDTIIEEDKLGEIDPTDDDNVIIEEVEVKPKKPRASKKKDDEPKNDNVIIEEAEVKQKKPRELKKKDDDVKTRSKSVGSALTRGFKLKSVIPSKNDETKKEEKQSKVIKQNDDDDDDDESIKPLYNVNKNSLFNNSYSSLNEFDDNDFKQYDDDDDDDDDEFKQCDNKKATKTLSPNEYFHNQNKTTVNFIGGKNPSIYKKLHKQCNMSGSGSD